MHRRAFIHTLGATLVTPAIACGMPRAGVTTARRLSRVGVQLYSLRDAAKGNLDKTLGDIAAIGYKDVELLMSNNNFGTAPAAVRAMLDKHGLRAPSTHIGIETLTQIDRAADEARILGHRYLILADVPGEARKSIAGSHAWADRLNRAGEAARKHDLWIGWHDEPQDFVTIDGQVAYDVMAARLDPSLVRLQLDTGNALMGGRDPLDLMNRYGDRYWSFHIKDAPTKPSERDTDLGTGILDLRKVLSLVKNIDDKHVYVEQESYPVSPLESIKRDYDYISKLTF